MLIGEIEQKTNIIFGNVEDFSTYINAIVVEYDSEVVVSGRWLYKLNTPHFNMVNRSQYGRGTEFKQDFVYYLGNICFIPISVNCFIKCIIHLTGKIYTEVFIIFTRTEQRQSNVVTSATIQPFCKKDSINIGCSDGSRKNTRSITEKMYIIINHKNHFCIT